MSEINRVFLKAWREKYRWPLHESRKASEERIIHLEKLVKNNVLENGALTVKDVLLKIVDWKTGGRFLAIRYFLKNSDRLLKSLIEEVRQLLDEDPNNVYECIKLLTQLDGVKIPIASTFLRFLDPIRHRYGIIDKNVACFLNDKGVTTFLLRKKDDYLLYTERNIAEYKRYHHWLQRKVKELANTTYVSVYGIQQAFTPVDIEMAIFAYMVQ